MRSPYKNFLAFVVSLTFLLGCLAVPFPAPTATASFTSTSAPTLQPSPTPEPSPTSTPTPAARADGIGDSYYPTLGNSGYDVSRYLIKLEVDPQANTINGSTEIDATATEPLNSFNLDLQGLTVDSVTVNGNPAQFSRAEDELIITPAQPLAINERFLVEVEYHGTPERRAVDQIGIAIGWSHSPSGAINMWGEPAAAASWFPNNNHPRDKAAYRFEITVPQPWIVAANGSLLETTEANGKDTFIWEMDEPMATYLATINIDRYDLVTASGPDGIVIRNYFPQDFPLEERASYDIIPEVLEFFIGLFGPYPFDEYGVVVASQTGLCDEASLALEAQTLSIHCPIMSFEYVIVHEAAHQWFGDSVSLENWQDIWLKEGFSTYSEWLWESKNGPDVIAQIARNYQDFDFDTPFPVAKPSPNDLYSVESYFGGAVVLQALREDVGEEAFFDILRIYAERYRYSHAGTDEFIAIATEIAGRDMTGFFEAWVYGAQLPKLP